MSESIYGLFGYAHARAHLARRRLDALPLPPQVQPRRRRHVFGSESGQGTVEYVGLILLVSLLMVGMVAAMRGFNGQQGTELADTIVNKIKQAVNKVTFK
jgi:hypothetical protein